MNFELLLIIAAIIFLASFVQGLTGFGFALISIPLLSLIMDLKEAVPLGVLCGLIVNIYLIIKLKQHVKFFGLRYLLFGAISGIPVGTLILTSVDTSILKTILGIIVILFVLLSVTNIIKQNGLHEKWGLLFGFFAGLFGGAFNTNGPPVLIYFYLHGFDKFKQKASITGFFIITSITIIIAHLVSGIATLESYKTFALMIPVILAAIVLGNSLFNKLSNQIYNRIVLSGLFITGIVLILK